MENVTLTQQEQARLQVLNNLLGYMTTEQAATLMGVSTRHTRRILAAYGEEGSSRTSSRQSRSQTCQRYTERIGERSSTSGAQPIRRSQPYAPERASQGTGGIDIGRDTLRKILTNAGVNSPRRRRPPKHRVRAAADATRGYADSGRRQLPQMARRGRTAVHAAAGGG